MSTWPWLPTRWNWEIVAQPLATLGAGAFAIGAAVIALHNGNKDREASENRHREETRNNKERELRKRFIEIVSLLSDDSDLTKREAGAYALASLSDDWANFYGTNKESSTREQQLCLNIIATQLRDKIDQSYKSEIIKFKKAIQQIILDHFSETLINNPRSWSHLNLDLSNCDLFKINIDGCVFSVVNFSKLEIPRLYNNIRITLRRIGKFPTGNLLLSATH